LKRLRARAGVAAVLGNHDSWLSHDRVRDALERNDIRVLEETAAKLSTPAGPVWLAGISDLWTGRHDIATALAAATNDGAPVILMTHNPDVFPLVPSKFGERFAAGHIVEGDRHLFVATGVGTSILPVRFRVPPAVTMLTVVFE
jgi:uncharacterized protein